MVSDKFELQTGIFKSYLSIYIGIIAPGHEIRLLDEFLWPIDRKCFNLDVHAHFIPQTCKKKIFLYNDILYYEILYFIYIEFKKIQDSDTFGQRMTSKIYLTLKNKLQKIMRTLRVRTHDCKKSTFHNVYSNRRTSCDGYNLCYSNRHKNSPDFLGTLILQVRMHAKVLWRR